MYTPLKITTDYTMFKSLIKINDLISFLHSKKITACAICDENLYGILDFYTSCKKNKIKPIIGLSVFLNNKNIYLYAMNYNGYKNLLKIHTIIEERDLSVVDLEKYKKDILVIIPYKNNDLYEVLSFYEYRYLSYSSLYEKNNALLITDNCVYVEDLRVLNINDIKYMEYLDLLRKDEKQDYSNNYYQELDYIDESKINDVVNLLNVEIPFNNRYIPKYKDDIDSSTFLKSLALKGLSKRLNGNLNDNYLKRLNYELDVINSMGFVDYFLIVYDYVLYAKKNNILVGPGRGSAAGSLISFSIGITDIDPLKYNLMFERFLNPERITMPDIDIDFDALRREEVINYVREKYGNKKVALGLTFNTLKSKLVLREVGKLLNVDGVLIDKFVKNIDASKTLHDNIQNSNIKKYLDNYSELKKVYDVSIHLEGLKKNTSTHAAGVVISSIELDEVIPIHKEGDILLTGVTMEYLEDTGLLKMDFLAVKDLTTIANITKKIGKNILLNIDLDDRKVYELYHSGDTEGIFQFDTPAMKNTVLKLKPTGFNDLIDAVALGRPGPKDHLEEYILRKNNKKPITYLHPDLESILKDTYGIIIYQEQIMAILRKFAGYSLAEADMIRRAISKKKENILKSEFANFVESSIKNGYDKEVAIKIYNEIVKFASYGFNKSHSVAYALVSFWMAYLKTYYKEYFVLELLVNSKDITKNNSYLSTIRSIGIKIIKPSVNNIYLDYKVEDNKLYLPLWSIKNISIELSKKIAEVKGDNFSDYFDFVSKTKDILSLEQIEKLIKAGALDFLGLNHQTLINNLDSASNYATLSDGDDLIGKPLIKEYDEYKKDVLRNDELDSFGFYITNHPVTMYNNPKYIKLSNINKYLFKKIYTVVCVDSIKIIKTKNGDDMAFILGSDDTASGDFTVFPRVFNMLENIKEKDILEIYGEVSKRFDKTSIIVNNIRKLGE